MKKRRKIFQRAAALLCCILLLPSLAAVPVLAADDTEFFDVLEFSTANDSGSQVVTGSLPMSVIYRTVMEPFRYIDMVVTCDIPNLTISYAGYNLNTILIGTAYGYTYRVYGDLVGDPSGYLAFTVSGTSGSWISFEQMKISGFAYTQSSYPTVGGIYLYPSNSNSIVYMPDANTEVKRILTWNNEVNYYRDFKGEVYLSDWKKYDYIDVYMEYHTAGITSMGVSIDDVAIPHTVTFIDSSFDHDSSINQELVIGTSITQRVLISIDLREVKRTSSYLPLIFLTGRYEGWSNTPYVTLRSVTGYVVAEASSPLGTFWKNLISALNQFFGSDSQAESASNAQQQVDYEANLYVVDAVDDWNSNIEYVETGFTSGLLFVTPAVAFISNMATRIFTNMGSFGSIYLLVGMMSVTMLLLSKSGVAAKIANSVRSSSKGGK